ncbi:MAG: DUF1080 domain-containing protein [Gemmataceae bacterium]|nr:DUF1080 domain-containing protein [Gemmataceae bacterium]
MFRTLRITFFAAIAASLGVLVSQAAAGDDKDFKDLFNGKDLAGWKTLPEKAEKVFSVKDDYIKVSGNPAGYFYTAKSYKNYVLKFDWRFKRPDNLEDEKKFGGNSGLLVHITGAHKVWPTSLEVQGANNSHGSFIAIGGKAVGLTNVKFDQATVHKVRNKVGEWNTTEVTIDNGDVIVKVNGAQVNSGKFTLTEGPFGFQSEGSELHFKNIKIKVLASGSSSKTEEKKKDVTKTEENKKETSKTEEKKKDVTKTEEKKKETTKTEEKKKDVTKTEENKKETSKTEVKKKTETTKTPPATTTPHHPPQAQVFEQPQPRGLFPSLRARLRGLFR